MSLTSFEVFGLVLILAYVVMCTIFLIYQKHGKSFFDKAFLWGGCLFMISYGLGMVAYAKMA
jgi:hypothetical protein